MYSADQLLSDQIWDHEIDRQLREEICAAFIDAFAAIARRENYEISSSPDANVKTDNILLQTQIQLALILGEMDRMEADAEEGFDPEITIWIDEGHGRELPKNEWVNIAFPLPVPLPPVERATALLKVLQGVEGVRGNKTIARAMAANFGD